MKPQLLAVLSLALALSSYGCSTTPVSPEIPRQKPVEAMQAEPATMCQLRPEIVNMAIEDALALIYGCRVMDAETYRRLEAKHGALRTWIEGE